MNESEMEVSNGIMPYSFPGISIVVPRQISGAQIVPITKGSISLRGVPHYNKDDSKEHFSLIRHIANVIFVAKATYDAGFEEPYPGFFDPLVEIYVGYNAFDVMATGSEPECRHDIHKLKLAYWNGGEWVIVSKKDYHYFILPPETGQVARFMIKNWPGDPPIAWGT